MTKQDNKKPVGKTAVKEAAELSENLAGGMTQSEGEILETPATPAQLEAALNQKEETNLHPFVPGQAPYFEPNSTLVLVRDQVNTAATDVEADEIAKAKKDGNTMKVVQAATKTLNHVDFSDQDLTDADFEGNDLRGAKFCGATLTGANFKNANLQGADFSYAKGMDKANFDNADMRWTKSDK